MTLAERYEDIQTLGVFNETELVSKSGGEWGESLFNSWEFYAIFHFTDEEFYYLDDVIKEVMAQGNDSLHETPKGIIYCYS